MIRSFRFLTAITAMAFASGHAAQAQVPGYPHPGMQMQARPAAYSAPMPMTMTMPAYAPPPMTAGACGPNCGPACGPGGDCYGMPAYVPPGMTHGGNVINYRVNQNRDRWSELQPVEAFITQLGRRSWLRLEYLNWDVEDPGHGNIGGRIANNSGRDPFLVEDIVNADQFGFAVVPGFDNITLDDNAGIRGTYGIWFNGGSVELSFFGTDQASDALEFGNLQQFRPDPPDPNDPNPPTPNAALGTPTNPNIIIPLTVDGIPVEGAVTDPAVPVSLAFLGFDSSYRATMTTQMWGTELNLLGPPSASTNGFTWQWLGGMRYTNYDETFTQTGVSDGAGAFLPVTTRIRAANTNNLYGPTGGLRMQLKNKYVTLSATPRLTMGLNDHTSRLSFLQADGNGVINQSSMVSEEVDFSAMTQVSFLAEIHCNEAFTVFGGYDFFWASHMVRPFEGIVYDSTVNVNTLEPQIGLQPDTGSVSVRGFSVGGVFRF